MEQNGEIRNVPYPSLKSLSHSNLMGGIFYYEFNWAANIHIMLGFFWVGVDVTTGIFPIYLTEIISYLPLYLGSYFLCQHLTWLCIVFFLQDTSCH